MNECVYEIVYITQSSRVAISPQRAFGQRIRALRTAAGLTQEDLAAHCGLFRTYMSRIETGVANPTLTMIHALAQSLGVSVAELFADAKPGTGTATSTATPVKHAPAKKARLSRGRVTR